MSIEAVVEEKESRTDKFFEAIDPFVSKTGIATGSMALGLAAFNMTDPYSLQKIANPLEALIYFGAGAYAIGIIGDVASDIMDYKPAKTVLTNFATRIAVPSIALNAYHFLK